MEEQRIDSAYDPKLSISVDFFEGIDSIKITQPFPDAKSLRSGCSSVFVEKEQVLPLVSCLMQYVSGADLHGQVQTGADSVVSISEKVNDGMGLEEVLAKYNITSAELAILLEGFQTETMNRLLRSAYKSPRYEEVVEEDFAAYRIYDVSNAIRARINS